MWPPLSKLLTALGKPLFPYKAATSGFTIGNNREPDSDGGTRWQQFTHADTLWQTWGPVSNAPWVPYHCVTLFASMDIARRKNPNRVGPMPQKGVPDWLQRPCPLPDWTREHGLMVILDLPGSRVASTAFHFITMGGFQPVCTFDNWPNPAGVLQPEDILAALLYYAAELSDARPNLHRDSPPVWICDSNRIGKGRPAPGRYDNRYFIDDRLLPGPVQLRDSGISRLVSVQDNSTVEPTADLHPYFADCIKQGMDLAFCSIETEHAFRVVQPLPPPDPRRGQFLFHGLIRSSAGGFGGIVPSSSSSGG